MRSTPSFRGSSLLAAQITKIERRVGMATIIAFSTAGGLTSTARLDFCS